VVLGLEIANDVVVSGAADITTIITAANTVATLFVNVMFLIQSRALP
jgi:hypothetical protein